MVTFRTVYVNDINGLANGVTIGLPRVGELCANAQLKRQRIQRESEQTTIGIIEESARFHGLSLFSPISFTYRSHNAFHGY
jgi:hypothetical protein